MAMSNLEQALVESNVRMLVDSMINRFCVEVKTQSGSEYGVCNMIEAEDGSGKHYNLIIGNKRMFITLTTPGLIKEIPHFASISAFAAGTVR